MRIDLHRNKLISEEKGHTVFVKIIGHGEPA